MLFHDFFPEISLSPTYYIGKPKPAIISERSHRGTKRSEIWASRVSTQCLQGTFDSQGFKVILRSFSAFPISVTLHLENGWLYSLDEKFGSWGKYTGYLWLSTTLYLANGWSWSETDEHLRLEDIDCIQDTFDILNVQGQSGVIQCISYFWQPCISKTAGLQSERDENLRPGDTCLVYAGYFWQLKCLRSVWGNSVHFRFSTGLRESNQLHRYLASYMAGAVGI